MRRLTPPRLATFACLGLGCAGLLAAWSLDATAKGPPSDRPPWTTPPPHSARADRPKPKVRPKPKRVKNETPPATPPPPADPPPPAAPQPPAAVPPPDEPRVRLPRPEPARPPARSPRPRSVTSQTVQPSSFPAGTAVSGRTRVVLARLALARDWISRLGTKKQRQTTLVFRLSRAALVEIVVRRVAPDCRTIGRFRIHGHAGVNRVTLRPRLGRRALRPGTYRLTARVVGARAATRATVRLVVVARPDARRAAAARGANACGAGRAQESGTATASGIGPSDGAGPPRASDNRTPLRRVSDVLAAKFTMVVDAARDVPPFLYAALVLAIALLALAVFPRHALPGLRAQALLAYNRKVIALAGTVAFATVVAGAYFVVW